VNLHALVPGKALFGASKAQLTEWLIQCKTGDKRLCSGLPPAWKVGDKTGAGERGTTNDVAVAWPLGQPPILFSIYLTGATGTSDDRNAVIAAVGKEIPAVLGRLPEFAHDPAPLSQCAREPIRFRSCRLVFEI
jgi:beta-lactamase class A